MVWLVATETLFETLSEIRSGHGASTSAAMLGIDCHIDMRMKREKNGRITFVYEAVPGCGAKGCSSNYGFNVHLIRPEDYNRPVICASFFLASYCLLVLLDEPPYSRVNEAPYDG